MDITGKITGIKYLPLLGDDLSTVKINEFEINDAPAAFLLQDQSRVFAISKWVSPKRTRSYPYERVYNTLRFDKKITVIPLIKDEGAAGDRDYLQWDTISLMSLLDVFVIFTYYDAVTINPRNRQKITNQRFNHDYVNAKIKEIARYRSSALHWNLNELKTNFHAMINEVKKHYAQIEKLTGVKLHNFAGIDRFRDSIGEDVSRFMQFSRDKSALAQTREMLTVQPKESVSTLSKSKITITNYLGGQYFFTVDEILLRNKTLYLIEDKHSRGGVLPQISDIKDGLVKMILYSNLTEVSADGAKVESRAVLRLTSPLLRGKISSSDSREKQHRFMGKHPFTSVQTSMLTQLFAEANSNNFTVATGASND